MMKLAALLVAIPVLGAAQNAAPPLPQYAPTPPQFAPPPRPRAEPPATVQAYRPEPQRDSWYIGFGLGTGDGKVDLVHGTADFEDMVYSDRANIAFNLRVGATLTPRLLLGFDGGFVASVADDGGYTSSVQLNYYDVGAMYFPWERGFFVRAATGLSAIVQELEPLGKASARGFNVIGGVGYAFWLGRSFNLTLNVDFARHWFDDAGVEGGSAWAAWLGFDWY